MRQGQADRETRRQILSIGYLSVDHLPLLSKESKTILSNVTGRDLILPVDPWSTRRLCCIENCFCDSSLKKTPNYLYIERDNGRDNISTNERTPSLRIFDGYDHCHHRYFLHCHYNDNNNNRIERRSSRFYYNLLTAPRAVSNTHAQVAQAQSCCKLRATRTTLITCKMSCATWYEGTAQLLRLAEFKSHSF